MTKTLADISEAMRDVDFCIFTSRAQDGSIGGRPMSNNRDVAYEGTSWFFTYENHRSASDIERDRSVGLSYQGSAGLLGVVGKPGIFIHVEGDATPCVTRRASPSTGARSSTAGFRKASIHPAW